MRYYRVTSHFRLKSPGISSTKGKSEWNAIMWLMEPSVQGCVHNPLKSDTLREGMRGVCVFMSGFRKYLCKDPVGHRWGDLSL